jgi:hypothetical protein
MARRKYFRSRPAWWVAVVAVIGATLLPLALVRLQPAAEAASKWSSSARVSPSRVVAGDRVAIAASLTAPGRRTVIVDLEVHDAAGRVVGQRLWGHQSFGDGQRREYRWNWAVPPSLDSGRYTAKIGVLGMSRRVVRHWNRNGAAFEVTRAVSPSTTTTTSTEPTTTTMPHEMDCDGIPMETPIGALPPAMPMLCDTLATGVASTFVNGTNSWIDDFNHHASMADLGPGYLTFERSSLGGTAKTGHFRHNEHWMADVYAPGQTGGTQMRPNRSFRFENGKLVVEVDVAAGIEDYDGFAWPELTVTTASSPTSSAAGRVGPTPGTSIGDDLYAYGQFGGQWSVGIRLTGSRPIAALYDDTHRGFPCGRVWEISWFQDGFSPGTGECPKAHQFSTWGGGEWAAPGAVRHCAGTDPDINCRDRFRWELTQSTITLYANGRKLMEHTALPGFKALPDAMVNSPVYVYLSDWVYETVPNQVVRYHWDRIAINPPS